MRKGALQIEAGKTVYPPASTACLIELIFRVLILFPTVGFVEALRVSLEGLQAKFRTEIDCLPMIFSVRRPREIRGQLTSTDSSWSECFMLYLRPGLFLHRMINSIQR